MTLSAIKPASFPWFPYEGFTFCLGLSEGEHAWTSGHTAASLDATLGKMTVGGTMREQARTAYEKVLTIVEGAGLSLEDVTHITENVTLSGLEHYEDAVAVRRELFGDHGPAITTVIVQRLVRSAAFLEVELRASRGGGTVLLSSEGRRPGTWTPSPVTEGHDGAVHLPTLVPIDEHGDLVAPDDLVGQYRYCLEQADVLLRRAGLSLDNAVTTYDYSTPSTRRDYRRTHEVRQELLGGAGVYPGAGGILMGRLHREGQLVAIDVTASRHPLELVNPGWARYDSLTYSPGVKAGRTLYMSGFASLDMETQQVLYPGDLGAQAEVTYDAIRHLLEHAGLRPSDLLSTVEFCVERELPNYRVVAGVRERRLSPPWPASTGAICLGLLRSEFLIEVFPTALYPASEADA